MGSVDKLPVIILWDGEFGHFRNRHKSQKWIQFAPHNTAYTIIILYVVLYVCMDIEIHACMY